MSTSNLILGGCVVLLGVKYLKRKSESDSGNPFVLSAIMDYYITPYNPGIVQYGNLIFSKKDISEKLELTDINIALSANQMTQSGYSITAEELERVVSFKSADMHNKSFTMPAHSETMSIPINIQVTQYQPNGNPFSVTSDFEKYPLSVLVDVSYKVNGEEFMETVEVPFTDYKKS